MKDYQLALLVATAFHVSHTEANILVYTVIFLVGVELLATLTGIWSDR